MFGMESFPFEPVRHMKNRLQIFSLTAVLLAIALGCTSCMSTMPSKKLVEFTEEVFPEQYTRRVAIDVQKIMVLTEADSGRTRIFWMDPNNQSSEIKLIGTMVIDSFPSVLHAINAAGK